MTDAPIKGRNVSRADYCALIGLLTLARGHNRALDDIERAMLGITGEGREIGGSHTSDAIYERDGDPRQAVDALLGRLNLAVEGGSDA